MATEEEHVREPREQRSDEESPVSEEEKEEETKFVEWDPTGRFGRTTQLLGRGTYKNVYMAFDEEEGRDVAWNQVKVSGLPREEKQRLMTEVEILKSLDHKNIIKLYHSWIVTEKDEVSVNFITEACAQTLKKYAAKLKTNLDLRAVKSWSRQILRGLDYLHSQSPPIVHRDLKCDNIFVNQNQGEVKIGDLGLAAMLDNNRTKSVIGTPEFMAPELYDEDYDERVDIYSFGMCIIELVTHECPYRECRNPAQIFKRVTEGVKPEALDKIIDADLRSFVLKCIAPINKRLTAKELMADPFLDKTAIKAQAKPKPTVEKEPEAPRPGGTHQFAVQDSAFHPASRAESSAAVGDVGFDANEPGADSGREDAKGGHSGSESGREGGGEHHGLGEGTESAHHSRAASERGEGLSRVGSDAGSESTSPTFEGKNERRPTYSDAVATPAREDLSGGAGGNNRGDAGVRNDQVIAGGASTAASSPVDQGEHGGEENAGKSRLARSSSVSRSHSEVDLAAKAAPEEGEAREVGRKKGGSLDFRVKGRILEDKTLRLRLKIGDASGHTRTVEFPFNTDSDSAYSVASEMVEELQLAQSDVRTIMREIENEVKFLNEGRAKAETKSETAGGGDPSPAPRPRSSAPDLNSGYASSDGERAGLIRPSPYRDTASSRSNDAGSPPPRDSPSRPPSTMPDAPPSRPPSTMPDAPAETQAPSEVPKQQQQQAPPPKPQPQQPPAAIVAPTPVMAYAAPEPPARMPSPSPQQPAGSFWQGQQPPQVAPLLEHQMQQMHVSQPQHPHPHSAHWRPGHVGAHPAAASSRASSVMSEGSVDEDDHAEEQRENALIAEMEERYAREQAELLRRHTEQMQIAQERIQRRKAERERKSLLGGVAMSSASSASSIASLAEMHAAGGAGYQMGAGGRQGAEIPGGRPPMPPVSPQGQGQGPPPPGTTPPGSPHVHQFHAHAFQQQQQVQPPMAQVVHAQQLQQQQLQQQQVQQQQQVAQHYQQQPVQVDPFAVQHNQPNATDPFAVQQPDYPAGPKGVAATAPLAAPPGTSLPPSHPGAGPTAAHAGVAAAPNMVRVDSRHSVATSGGSGHNSADEGVGPKDAMFCLMKDAKDKDKAKAEKSAKAKEKLMDLEAKAMLGLGKSSKESKGEGMKSKTGLGMKESMKAMKSTDSVASAAGGVSTNGTHNDAGSSADELNPQEAQVYEVKNTATAQAYDGDVPILPHQTPPQDAMEQQ